MSTLYTDVDDDDGFLSNMTDAVYTIIQYNQGPLGWPIISSIKWAQNKIAMISKP